MKALTSVQLNGHKNGPLDFQILRIVTASVPGRAKDPKSILSLRLFYFSLEIGFPCCRPGCLGTHFNQLGLELRDLPAPASQVLRLKVCSWLESLVKI